MPSHALSSTPSALPSALQSPVDVLVIDNFDSFTFNLYQALCLLGRTPTVIRNDAIAPSLLPALDIKALVISPGPGHPRTDSGISRNAIKHFAGKVPILGVCMGLECLVDVFGGEISYAGEIVHGKLSAIRHDGRGIFKSLPQFFKSTRYHSLAASQANLPPELLISATSASSGVIMAVRHRKFTIEGVQYHPESVLSEHGDQLLRNFLSLKGGLWEENRDFGVLDDTLPPFPMESLASSHLSKEATAKIPTILEKICAQRLTDVQLAKSTPGTTLADLSAFLALNLAPPLIPFVSRLKTHLSSYPASLALMAEFKRASPSKGPIALSASAPSQALVYALSGASVISVLTESHFFKGLLSDLAAARKAIDHLPNRPALLRKDFILDEYQIAEARVHGADTVLLIVATLSPPRLRALYDYSLSLGMEPLVEVNNATEMNIALELGAKVIGVNNRNLHNFNVDTGTTSRLADMVQGKDVILCALSGISCREDVQRYKEQGVRAVLIGEALMRAPDPRAFITDLLDRPALDVPIPNRSAPLVKICGIRSADEALACVSAGADMLGLMFVPSSKRHISLGIAQQICSAVRPETGSSKPPSQPQPQPSFSVPTPWFTTHANRLVNRRPLIVGVFQNQTLDEIYSVLDAVPLDLIQLHGDEPVEWAKFLPVPVIKAFHMDSPEDVSSTSTSEPDKGGEEGKEKVSESASGSASLASNSRRGLADVTRPGCHQFVLLDAVCSGSASGLSGGSGKTVDWVAAQRVVEAGELPIFEKTETDGESSAGYAAFRYKLPVILAGGLTPSNVGEAIDKVEPWAVDVSGGVETEDGSGKDLDKVARFVKAVQGEVYGKNKK